MKKELLVTESLGVARTGEFVRLGIPFPTGEAAADLPFCVAAPDGSLLPTQAEVLKKWPDGSLKWLLADFPATLSPHGTARYRLLPAPSPPPPQPLRIVEGKESWEVDTGGAVFTIDSRVLRPFSRVRTAAGEVLETAEVWLASQAGERMTPLLEGIRTAGVGPLRATLQLHGRFAPVGACSPRFSCRIEFFSGKSSVLFALTIHNPRRARHSGGIWDLGDSGSLLFREMAMSLILAKDFDTAFCSPEKGLMFHASAGETVSVYQESSGGENWRSPVHRNRQGIVPLALQGYVVTADGRQAAAGVRAVPLAWCGRGETGVAAVLPRFWQQFPKGVTSGCRNIAISFFPGCFPDLHELQGGERTTTTLYLDFCVSQSGLEWARLPLCAAAEPQVFRRSRAIPELPPEGEGGDSDLFARYAGGAAALLAKRERADQYGWRNFGDIHADHEAVYHPSPAAFPSHYNNQYDLCGGLYRRFMSSGSFVWQELAGDMAAHLLDIDIYHTSRDREEYNGGLFWHTDHYLPAGLATHRSFSREHLEGKPAGHAGGGPGAEHCYTGGLMLHYFLTGDSDYRDAITTLADWSFRLLAGPRPVLAVLKSLDRYASLLMEARRRPEAAFPRYPLTRGTGNAISASLDALELTGNGKYLEQAEELVRGAIHPADDIDGRKLLDAERCWSYTVFLAALGKYLEKKVELGALDEMYAHGRQSLLAYSRWMLRNEYPYLDKPEILEYPNETWPAQDLRKCVVFLYAARHSLPEERGAFVERGRYFFAAAREELDRHATSALTRPLALMLQNDWAGNRLEEVIVPLPPPAGAQSGTPPPPLGVAALSAKLGWELTRALAKISLQREICWLHTRLRS